jgi:diguanylate cyclase (GGDEF)-like protein
MPDSPSDDLADHTSPEGAVGRAAVDAVAVDGDVPAAGGARAHELSADIRARTAWRREQSADARLVAADKRDAIAHARDLAALARDQAADARNLAMAQSESTYAQDDGRTANGAELVIRASGQRKRAARRRAQAVEQGALAARDRRGAAQDREQAARERLHALADREVLADELAIAEIDPLTGARTRAAGLIDLDRELDRCRRTAGRLVVAYIDVVGLKTLNDTEGHDAGDELLRRAVQLIKEHVRPYDVIIRVGGDEFVCAMSDASLANARRRFAEIAAALAAAPERGAIRTGFAELTADETARELIARADSQLIDSHRADHDMRTATSIDAHGRPHERRTATPHSIAPLRQVVIEFAGRSGASDRQREDIAVAVSEALSNVVVHAYAGWEEPGVVTVDAWMSNQSLEVVVCDEGIGMLPRTDSPGLGLGLALIVRMTQRVALEETTPGVRVRMTFAIG